MPGDPAVLILFKIITPRLIAVTAGSPSLGSRIRFLPSPLHFLPTCLFTSGNVACWHKTGDKTAKASK